MSCLGVYVLEWRRRQELAYLLNQGGYLVQLPRLQRTRKDQFRELEVCYQRRELY